MDETCVKLILVQLKSSQNFQQSSNNAHLQTQLPINKNVMISRKIQPKHLNFIPDFKFQI